jgi:hypothetical protein
MVLGFTSVLRIQYMMARRNRYFKGSEDRQMLHVDTLIFIPTLKTYVFLYSGQMDGQTDRQTDRQTEKLIWGGAG